MKRVLCPKCDNYITFDETKYTEGPVFGFYMRALQKAIQYPHRKIQIKSYPQRGGS